MGEKVIINKKSEIQLQIVINNNLFKKGIIDEDTYLMVNDKLLKLLKNY